MTTGPSSGHSESWYWLQSSHPADRQPASGAQAPEDTAGLQPRGATDCAPHKYKTVQTQDVPPRKRPSSTAHSKHAEPL